VPAATAPRKKLKPCPGNGPPSTNDSDIVRSARTRGPTAPTWPPESEVNGDDDDASSLVLPGPEPDEDEYTGKIEKD